MELDTESSPTGNGVPFKVVDLTREKRKGVVASTLQDLITRGKILSVLLIYFIINHNSLLQDYVFIVNFISSVFFLARVKMDLPEDIPVKIVLEQDGTEIDDDEYFSTMERNTTLMILINDQRWLPPGKLPRLE
jgi:DNA fragmentation factor alpha subunit